MARGGGKSKGAGSKPLVVLQIKRPRKLKENCTAQLSGVIQPIKKGYGMQSGKYKKSRIFKDSSAIFSYSIKTIIV